MEQQQIYDILTHATEIERLRDPFGEVYAWMREPDWIEEASLAWLTDWINRRPLGAMRALADLVPAPESTAVVGGSSND